MSSLSTPSGRLVPQDTDRALTLSGVIRATTRDGGVSIVELEPLTVLVVRTANSLYRVTVLEPYTRQVMVEGGSFFSSPTRGTFTGSSGGGQALKLGWFGLGLRLEFLAGGQRVVTSRVRTFEVERAADDRPS